MSFNDYIKEYCNNDSNRFNYDKNFGKKEMLDYIDYLTEFVCDYDKQILMEIKNIFEPKRSNNFDKIYNETKKIKSNIPFNLRDVCHYGPGLSYYNECRKNIATKKALEEGKRTDDIEYDPTSQQSAIKTTPQGLPQTQPQVVENAQSINPRTKDSRVVSIGAFAEMLKVTIENNVTGTVRYRLKSIFPL